MPNVVTVQAHRGLTNELAASLRELGDIRAAIVSAQAGVWANTAHFNITERRETCRYAAADLEAEAAKVTGQVEALRAELNTLEIQLRYGHADA